MKNIEENFAVPLTRPAAAGHPLPSGEGFAPKNFLHRFYAAPVAGRDSPMIRAGEQFRDKPCMQRVSGAIRNNPSLNRLADQRKVPEQIENLMPYEFIRKSERRFVEHSLLRENDGILQRATSHESAGLQLLHFFIEAKRPCRCDKVGVIHRRNFHFKLLIADQGMRKADFILDAETLRRMDSDGFRILFEGKGFCDANDTALHIQHNDSDALDRFNVLQPAAIQNRNLKVIELHKGIVDPKAVQSGKQMLHGGNPDAALHQRCGIRNALDRTDVRAKFKIVEVDAAEYDSRSGWRRKNAHRRRFTGMQADAAEFHWRRDRLFSHSTTTMQFTGRCVLMISKEVNRREDHQNVYI
jgi:hypothetical protein